MCGRGRLGVHVAIATFRRIVMAAIEEAEPAYSASFESEGSVEEEVEESLELGKIPTTAAQDHSSGQRDETEEENHMKRSEQVLAQKPPSRGVSTDKDRYRLELTGRKEQLLSQKTIHRGQHIGGGQAKTNNMAAPAQGGDVSETSLALSNQVRHDSFQSSQLREAVFAEWLVEKGSHMKKERQAAALKKQQQQKERADKMVEAVETVQIL